MGNTEVDLLAAMEAVMNEEFNQPPAPADPLVEPAAQATPELTIDGQGRPHGPDGKFVSLQEETSSAQQPPEEETPAEPETEEETSEEVEEEEVTEEQLEEYLEFDSDHPFFAKYGGDPGRALAALEESQRIIGERAYEVGDLRKEIQSLREAYENQPQPVYHGPYRSDIDENPQALAYEASERGDWQTMYQALKVWAEESPLDANLFLITQMAQNSQEPEPQAGPQGSVAGEMEALRAKYPDLQETVPAIEKILQERSFWADAIKQGDPRARVQALEDVYLYAKSQAISSDTSKAVKRVVLRAKVEADKAKSDAAVVSASNTSAANTGPSNPNANLQQALRDISGLDDLVIV